MHVPWKGPKPSTLPATNLLWNALVLFPADMLKILFSRKWCCSCILLFLLWIVEANCVPTLFFPCTSTKYTGPFKPQIQTVQIYFSTKWSPCNSSKCLCIASTQNHNILKSKHDKWISAGCKSANTPLAVSRATPNLQQLYRSGLLYFLNLAHLWREIFHSIYFPRTWFTEAYWFAKGAFLAWLCVWKMIHGY